MMSTKLASALHFQEAQVQRVGSNRIKMLDPRLPVCYASDSRSLRAGGRWTFSPEGSLLSPEDVVAIEVQASLRQREDIPLHGSHFLRRAFAETLSLGDKKVLRQVDSSDSPR